ncbi:MAG: hypothetical protein O7D96_10870 [SAR324 cluster bacterium]|nr:hypothetical protein [SAR324 cluster bacterium]
MNLNALKKAALPILILLVIAFGLSACPGKRMDSGSSSQPSGRDY